MSNENERDASTSTRKEKKLTGLVYMCLYSRLLASWRVLPLCCACVCYCTGDCACLTSGNLALELFLACYSPHLLIRAFFQHFQPFLDSNIMIPRRSQKKAGEEKCVGKLAVTNFPFCHTTLFGVTTWSTLVPRDSTNIEEVKTWRRVRS